MSILDKQIKTYTCNVLIVDIYLSKKHMLVEFKAKTNQVNGAAISYLHHMFTFFFFFTIIILDHHYIYTRYKS